MGQGRCGKDRVGVDVGRTGWVWRIGWLWGAREWGGYRENKVGMGSGDGYRVLEGEEGVERMDLGWVMEPAPPTGFVKHTPTKLRAPAYSFRGAPMLLAENCSPGPRYSVNPKILRTGKDLGPAYSILGRYHTKTMMTPGPGEGPGQCPVRVCPRQGMGCS